MTRISASKIREDFSDTLNRVAFGGERVVVHRNNKDVAALISMEDFAVLRRLVGEIEDRLDVKAALKALETDESIPLDEL
jgi:prevent-host-death family protein